MVRTVRACFRFTAVLLIALFSPGRIASSGAGDSIPQDNLGIKTLMVFCSGAGPTDAGLCNGYILGVAEAMNSGQTIYGQRACNTQGIRAQELSDLVRMSLNKNNRQLETQKAGPVIADVLARAYPCQDADDQSPILDRRVTAEPLPEQPLTAQ